MTPAINAAASGLVAQQVQLDSTARNIANATTPGYKREETTFEATSDGVRAETSRVEKAGPIVPAEPGTGVDAVELSNVDLTREVPRLIEASRGFEADLKTLKTQDEMLGMLLNIVG